MADVNPATLFSPGGVSESIPGHTTPGRTHFVMVDEAEIDTSDPEGRSRRMDIDAGEA